jgi:hypothetical protein
MATMTCPRCSHRFETKATTSTRCPSCRKVVTIGHKRGERWDLGLLLECGHLGAARGMPFGPNEAAKNDGDCICGICGAEDQEVAAAAGRPWRENTADWLLAHMVEVHPDYVWKRYMPVILNSAHDTY